MKSAEIKNPAKDYGAARSLVESFLNKSRVSDAIVYETMLIFEAVCYRIFEQEAGNKPAVTVTGRKRFRGISIILNYEGGMFIAESDTPGEPTPEDRIFNAYADRIDYSYRSHFNSIRIQARRSYVGASVAYLVAILLAFVVFAVLRMVTGGESDEILREKLFFPLETLFANGMLMIGAPVTFLSLLKHLTDTYILSERDSGIRKITRQTLVSSLICVLLAVATCKFLNVVTSPFKRLLEGYGKLNIHMELGSFIRGLMPSDIFTPFQTISPFPLILLAALVTYAFCSVGKYFDKMMDAIDVCYALFARMLTIVMVMLPFFTFCATMDVLLVNNTADVLLFFSKFIVLIIISMIVPMIYYSLRLAVRGISIWEFFKRSSPYLRENFKIASVIDAVPYNIRYCMRNYGLDRKKLETNMPVLAQVNLDGNCYMLTLISLILVTFSSPGTSLWEMLLIAMLVFVLSLGAPNQPGSCIIGILIILHYVQAYTFIPFAIFAEVFFGALLNLMNVTGDIITEVVNERPKLLMKKQ